jgi:glutamate racemase
VEQELTGSRVPDAAILAEIAPCFRREKEAATDVIVLACTHFPLLLERFEKLAPWPVTWLDPAPAIARRVVALLGERAGAGPRSPTGAMAYFTSGQEPGAQLAAALARFGLSAVPAEEASPIIL